MKTVPQNDHLIDAPTEDRFIDSSVAHDCHWYQVTSLHCMCSFSVASCVTKTLVCLQKIKRAGNMSPPIPKEENHYQWKDNSVYQHHQMLKGEFS